MTPALIWVFLWWMMDSLQHSAIGPAGLWFPLKPGRPFVARYENVRVWQDASGSRQRTRQSGSYYVDSRGRLREETQTEGLSEVFIHDPVAGEARTFDGASMKLRWRVPLASDRDPAAERLPPLLPDEKVTASESASVLESLGTQMKEGLLCNGVRIRSKEKVRELWISVEFGLPMEITEVGAGGQSRYRLFDLRFEEPDPVLFVLPNRE